jgi:t-SNARE complex subunit (syntaxin)
MGSAQQDFNKFIEYKRKFRNKVIIKSVIGIIFVTFIIYKVLLI